MAMVMCHVRAFRFVHALCFDVVVCVFCSLVLFSVSCPFRSVWCLWLVFLLVFLCFFSRFGDQTAGGHWLVSANVQ